MNMRRTESLVNLNQSLLNIALAKHPDTWLDLEETRVEHRFDKPYRKTYPFEGPYIDSYHRWLDEAPRHEYGMINIGIEGWLLPPDALKLYEMAYFSDDILELGTFKGLSTTIACMAIFNSGRKRPLVTVDLDLELSERARQDMERRLVLGRENTSFFVFDAIQFVKNMSQADRRFSFAFVDHSHVYEHVRDCCEILHEVIVPGGFVLFHDFNDPRNADVNNPDYGVYQGVTEGLKEFAFFGIYGCTSLWRRL